MFSTERRGQVGIGTLIVFIAMVLVAAIAAGVLINTAGLLQAQAQQTGEETTAEVSNVVQVGEVVGIDGNNSGEIEKLKITTRLASGSDPINISKASYTIATNGNATVVSGDPLDSDYVLAIEGKQGTVSGDTRGLFSGGGEPQEQNSTGTITVSRDSIILAEQQDVAVITMNLTGIFTDRNPGKLNPLGDNSELQIVAQAPAGGNTYKQLSAPRRINEGDSYIL